MPNGTSAVVTRRSIPVVLRPLRQNDKDKHAASTDVLYDEEKREAFHRTKDGKVLKHHDAHDADSGTVVHVFKKTDQIIWFAERPFTVSGIATHAEGEATNPFLRELPLLRSNDWNYIESGPIKPDAQEGRYKVTFDFGDGKPPVDPDFQIHD